jgi:hypothetical protein
MNAPTHDRLRAWITGQLTPPEVERLERELAADAALAERAREFRRVWEATEALATLAPLSRTSFADVLERARVRARGKRRRVAAAAAILLLPAGWLAWRALRVHAAGPVPLEIVSLEPAVDSAPVHAAVPEALASYAPVEQRSVRWLSSFDDARGVSEAVGRPLLVFGYMPGCPWCKTLREQQFTDATFLALAERCVPVAIDLSSLDETSAQTLTERGYPVIELQTERGELLHGMSGPPGEVDINAELARGLTGWPAEPPALAWSAANEMARILGSSLSSERQGRLLDALHGYGELEEHGGGFTLTLEGRAGRQRIAEAARQLLLAARARAEQDPEAARSEFERGIEPFAGTPYERDLRQVLAAWREQKRFPELAAPRT